MKKLFIVLVCFIAFSGCQKALYLHHNYDELTYTYSKGGWDDKETKRLIKQYKVIVDLPKKSKIIPPPGACADYAYMLLQQRDTVKAKEFFDKEMLIYPESKTYVEKLKTDLGL